MKNAWFVLLLLASILTHAAIIDAARLAPVAASKAYAPCPPPVIEARGGAQPAQLELVGKSACPAGDLARGERVLPPEAPEWRLVAGR